MVANLNSVIRTYLMARKCEHISVQRHGEQATKSQDLARESQIVNGPNKIATLVQRLQLVMRVQSD